MRSTCFFATLVCAGVSIGPLAAQTCDGFLDPGEHRVTLQSGVAHSSIQDEIKLGANWIHSSGAFVAAAVGRTGYSDRTQREIVGGRYVFDASLGWDLAGLSSLHLCPIVGFHEEFGPARPPGIQDFEVRRWRGEIAVGNPVHLTRHLSVIPGGSFGIVHRREWDTETQFRAVFGDPGDPSRRVDGETHRSGFARTWLAAAGRISLGVGRHVALRLEYRAPLTHRNRVRSVASAQVALGAF